MDNLNGNYLKYRNIVNGSYVSIPKEALAEHDNITDHLIDITNCHI